MSSTDMRKIMERINGVDSLNLPKTEKFPMIKNLNNPISEDVDEEYLTFEEDYDRKSEEFENHLLHSINLLKDLKRMLSMAEKMGFDVRQKRDFLEHHLKYSIEELESK